MRSDLVLTVCGVALLLGGWLVFGGTPTDEGQLPAVTPEATASPAREASQPPRSEPSPAAKVETAAGPKDGFLSLPDGTRVPALNGVVNAVELLWPRERPWSPITGLQTDPDGLQWYVHADGSRSTTQMVWRSDLGRKVSMSIVANPEKAAPMRTADQEEQRAKARATEGRRN